MNNADNADIAVCTMKLFVCTIYSSLIQFIAAFLLHQTNIWVQMFTLMSRSYIFTSPCLLILLIFFLSQAFHKLVIVRRLIVECDIIGN